MQKQGGGDVAAAKKEEKTQQKRTLQKTQLGKNKYFGEVRAKVPCHVPASQRC
jgi:hypothetical protein